MNVTSQPPSVSHQEANKYCATCDRVMLRRNWTRHCLSHQKYPAGKRPLGRPPKPAKLAAKLLNSARVTKMKAPKQRVSGFRSLPAPEIKTTVNKCARRIFPLACLNMPTQALHHIARDQMSELPPYERDICLTTVRAIDTKIRQDFGAATAVVNTPHVLQDMSLEPIELEIYGTELDEGELVRESVKVNQGRPISLSQIKEKFTVRKSTGKLPQVPILKPKETMSNTSRQTTGTTISGQAAIRRKSLGTDDRRGYNETISKASGQGADITTSSSSSSSGPAATRHESTRFSHKSYHFLSQFAKKWTSPF